MSDVKRLKNRNEEIAAMLSDGKTLRNFYRFTAQNPHIALHNACQIILDRPNASVCFSFEEWNAMGRRVTKGKSGIAYYDSDGYRKHVFDANDTHGDKRFKRLIYPMKRLLLGLDSLNGTELSEDIRGDYRKIHNGVATYLEQNNYLEGNENRNRLRIEGITYSLYSRTGFPKDSGITMRGLPYSLQENAQIFKEIYKITAELQEEIEEAYIRKQEEVKVIDDTEEENVSDEQPEAVRNYEDSTNIAELSELSEEPKKIVEVHSACHSNYKGYVALLKMLPSRENHQSDEVYLGKTENYDSQGHYDNTDNSLIFVSNNPQMYTFLYSDGWTESQQYMVDQKMFSAQDYKDFYDLQQSVLKNLECTYEIKFSIDINVSGSGTPFRYPDWQDKKEEQKPIVTPFYQKYLDIQNVYPKAAVAYRLGDFFEIMGEKAVEVSQILDLTLTGRNVGLPERVPMCGFPYHVTDKYIEKILEKLPVVVVEDGEEPKYILSHSEVNTAEQTDSEVIGEHDDNDWTDEEIDEVLSEENDDYNEDEQSEEEFSDEAWNEQPEAARDYDDEFEELDSEQEEEKPSQPQEKKGKPIKERKRKEKPQLSIFDMMEGKTSDEQSPEENVKEWGLKYGSGFQDGKFRIYDKYQTNPTANEFAVFLKNEYGTGGSSGNGRETASDGKGFTVAVRDKEHPEQDVIVKLSWVDVANGNADLIDDKNYFTAAEQEEYDKITEKRNARIFAKTDEEKLKAITRQFIEDGTKNTWNGEYTLEASKFEESADYVLSHRAELEQILLSEKEIKAILPTPNGYEYLYKNNIYVEFYPKYCRRLINDEEQTEEIIEDEQSENTNLTEIGVDSSDHGGAKSRFQDNLKAIRLVNRLYDEDSNPTSDEKRVLARYVGWGGLAQAFDERDEKWQKEYAELKQTLSVEDYDRAKGSVLNAHYTSKEVIEGMYKALERFGVKGNNRILEPAMGTGNFFGYMPKIIAEHAKLYGVELDNITGRIATKLYPNVSVQVKGFEQTSFSNDSFDLMISNVPFGAYSVYDSEYAKHNFYIHDYFIAKGLDKIKPNGLMVVITSKGTMDKLNPTVRKYLADRAELLGAIRLPNTAFQKTANTQVVTDILFFRKRAEKISSDTQNTEWLATGKTEQGYEINNYYINHPEMVLGTLVEERGLYGALDVTVKPDGRELSVALNEAISRLPQDFYVNPTEIAVEEAENIEVDYDVKPLCYKAENGRLYIRIGDTMQLQQLPKNPKDAYERIAKMISLRNELRHILELQTEGCSDEKLFGEQRILNASYDSFVRKYGYLNSQTNKRLFREDGDSALLFACEDFDEKERTAKKQAIFSKRTIRPYTVPTATDDCFEALQISKNERGKVEIAYIEELTKKDYDTVLTELGNSVFRNPMAVVNEDKYSGFETAEEYLSGNVAKKLSTAQTFAAEFPSLGYETNVNALEQVQPQKVTASEISVRLGASWVDKSHYKQFLCYLLHIPSYYADGLDLYYNPHDSSWRIDKARYISNYSQVQTKEIYGTERANAFRLFEDCLNLKATSIYDTVEEDGREKRVLNQPETIAAREKQNKIKDAFKDWIFHEPERREELEDIYNRLFNQIKLPSYDGSYLRFPEMNPAIELKSHQKNAVHRIITGGNTLLHHVVGSGKTFTICATIMKLRQYGLSKKAMIAVPNHLVQQWADEFRKLYPNANLLTASKEDLDKDNRQRFVSKVAMGDWDAVIIAQSSFAKIPISPERQINKIREEISRIETTIEATWEENGMPRGAVKNLERIKKSREVQLKKLLDDDKKDNLLTFESLGVDYLFVDEAHYYKNLFLFTKMNNVAGISSAASQRASDLKLKCEYINELQGGDKGVVFATGTPISNSMTEMYTMQTYLQQRTLEELGITYFDGWAADFGETVTSLEMAPSGQGYKAKTRFAKFTNMPELLGMYRSFADVQTSDMVKLEVPDVERNVVTLKPSETVIEMAEEISDRAEKISGGNVDPHIDNMLKVTSDGKKLALDARCFDSTAADESGSKINECAFRVFGIWEKSKETKGTQLIFCDLSTPKKAYEDYENGNDFDVYNDLKYKLTQMGIPKEEIAFIHDANTDDQKQKLFDSVNSGNVRVLIGSTGKCGAGTNIQKHLVALHHLDTPYRPSDMQQREGRIIRQGNENKNVQIFTYVTERTFDSYSYQILENKQRFISQIDKGDLTVREADDIDETTLSYAEIKAITAANPKIKRKMEIDTEVARLRVLEGQYKKNLYSLQDKVRKEYPEAIRRQELYLERAKQDIERIKEHYNPDVFSINVSGMTYTDKKEGVRALYDALMASTPETVVAEYGGFKISINPLVLLTAERSITLAGSGQYVMDIGSSAIGNMTRLDNFFADFQSREERLTRKLEQLHKDYETAEEQLKKPFEHAETLAALVSEQTQINAELDLNKREEIIIDDSDEDAKVTDDEAYTALPEQEKKPMARRKQRKALDKYSLSVYDKQKADTPDAYIFIRNGDKYEIIGETAKEYAESHELPIISDKRDGANISVLSFENGALDKAIAELVESGKTVKIIEYLEEKQEVDFIDNEDKVAEMQVRVLPDYSVNQDTMHNMGYTWDGMLPIRKNTALILSELGLNVYALKGDDTENEIKEQADIEEHDGLFGIEKPDWNAFLDKDKGREYLAARFFIAMAAQRVAVDELSYVEAIYIEPFIDNNLEETENLRKFLSEATMPDAEKMMPYTNGLLEEFTARIYGENLQYYGWTEDNLVDAIASGIVPEELKENAKAYVEIRTDRRLQNFVNDGLKEIKWLNGRTENFAEDEIEDIKNDLKPHFEDSEWDKSNDDYPYDYWYEDFAEEKLPKYLSVIPEMNEEKETVGETNDAFNNWTTNEEVADYKAAVIDSVNKEFEKFKTEFLKMSQEEIFNRNYEIHVKTELHEVICEEDYLSDKEYRALYEEKGHALQLLYDDFIDTEHASVDDYGLTAEFIEDYCYDHHEDIMNDFNLTEYYGKDTEDTAYYRFPKGLSHDSLPAIKNQASDYVIAAPTCVLSDEEKEKYHIFFLKIGRDITEEELSDPKEAITNMQKAVDRINNHYEKHIPIYYQSAEHAYEHGEQGLFNNSANVSRECIKAIGDGIAENYHNNILGKDFENGIVKRFGLERIDYVLATIIQKNDWDLRYSKANKEWAKTIPISESQEVQKKIYTNAHPGLVDLFASRIRKYNENTEKKEELKLEQDKFLSETHQGYKIIQTTKDNLGRNVAVVQREKDFAVGAGYNTQDGTWAQGYYDFSTLEAAKQFVSDEYDANKTAEKPKKNWIRVNVSQEALIKTYEKHHFMRMPETSEYAGYTYNVFNNHIKESRQIADLQSDSRELSYELLFDEDEIILLKTRDGDEVELTVTEFKEAAGGSTAKDYVRKESENDRKWLSVNVPQDASRGSYENASLFVLPNKNELAGYSFYVPNSFASEDKDSEDGRIVIQLPDDFEITAKNRNSGEEVKLTAVDLYKCANGTQAEDYVFERKERAGTDEKDKNGWKYVSVSDKAKIAEYENRTLLKMPSGEYAGFTYYLPNALIKENDNDTLRLSLPKDLIIAVKDGKSGEVATLSADAFIEEVKGKSNEDYVSTYQKPSEGKPNKFKYEEALRKNIPDEMKKRSNWVIVRTKENADTGRLDKYLIDCHTGKFAESDNPETWTDFETACAYAKENGGESLAYALDGKDKICCVDVDNCKIGNDFTSNVPSEIAQRVPGTYTENSISGKGVHIFGKTDGMDLRTFSTDGKLEFYQKAHFMAMTGDSKGISGLKSFDTPNMKTYLEGKCAKRTDWKGTGKGVDGLSSMSDRDVVEKAESSKHGDTFKALYSGQDLQNNHSNSDMSLMNRLAFWCNGDKEQMLRIFATSGLYREGKSPDYYEGTAIKAIKDTTSRFQPQAQNSPKPVANNASGSGKR